MIFNYYHLPDKWIILKMVNNILTPKVKYIRIKNRVAAVLGVMVEFAKWDCKLQMTGKITRKAGEKD